MNTWPTRRLRGALKSAPLLGALAVVLALASFCRPASAQAPELTPRAVIVLTAMDGFPSSLPQPDPAYCRAAGGPGSTPPNSILGTLTIGGQPAPAGTVVQLVIGGKLGPADATLQAGGYRVDYDLGAEGCSNQQGASIAVLVSGQVFPAGITVGSEAANPFFRFDIAVP